MPKSRLEMVMADEATKVDDSAKLRQQADEFYALKVTLDSRGWKEIIGKYLANRLDLNRFLQTKTTQERHEMYGALNEVQEFISFLEQKLKDGENLAIMSPPMGG